MVDLITYVSGHKVRTDRTVPGNTDAAQIARVSGVVNTCIKERMEESSKTMKPVTSDDFVSAHAQVPGHLMMAAIASFVLVSSPMVSTAVSFAVL